MADYRHHHAAPNPVIVFVGGAPEPMRHVKPGRYPRQSREPWRPQRNIPRRDSKGAALKRLVEQIARQEETLRAMLTPHPPRRAT
jgi:hypothetical protein